MQCYDNTFQTVLRLSVAILQVANALERPKKTSQRIRLDHVMLTETKKH